MARTGRPEKYPWDDWFGQIEPPGGILDLLRGVDYDQPSRAMATQIRNKARARALGRLNVKLVVPGSGVVGGERLAITAQRRRAYPWDDWLDGETHVLVWERDFEVTLSDMGNTARRAARARGLHLRTRISGEMIAIKATSEPYRPRPHPHAAALARQDADVQHSNMLE